MGEKSGGKGRRRIGISVGEWRKAEQRKEGSTGGEKMYVRRKETRTWEKRVEERGADEKRQNRSGNECR